MSALRFKGRFWFALAAFASIAIAAVGSGVFDSGDPSRRLVDLPVYRLDADHATYPDLSKVTGDAEVILTGEVLSHSTEPGKSPGVDALGDPLPPVPHVNYSVSVLNVLKGAVTPGSVIVVSLSGGTTESGEFVLDGAPEIHDGEVSMFFLEPVGDRYYPLAGGAAVATQASAGNFELPADATGQESLDITEAAVVAAIQSPAVVPQNPASDPRPAVNTPVKRVKRCKAGFKKKKVKGRTRCVKVKRRHKKRQHPHHN